MPALELPFHRLIDSRPFRFEHHHDFTVSDRRFSTQSSILVFLDP
jgi:hypothetical protein